jgi:CBS domain-containing protein
LLFFIETSSWRHAATHRRTMMKNTVTIKPVAKANKSVRLAAKTAAEIMTPNPISIRQDATIHEAVALLTDKGISAAPVIDNAGRPVGVLSRADILVHDRERIQYLAPYPEYYHRSELTLGSGDNLSDGFQVEQPDASRVRDIMTPAVFSVAPDSSSRRVVEDMVALKVHRLFVVDQGGVLVGVISALDVLRHMVS